MHTCVSAYIGLHACTYTTHSQKIKQIQEKQSYTINGNIIIIRLNKIYNNKIK